MTPEERLKTCCVAKCTNTPLNSKVNFYSFPEARWRSVVRNKWVQAIKNGRWWTPTVHSFVCSDHFVKGQPSTNCQDIDYVPSVFTKKIKEGSMKPRVVSVKKFALEYIKHDVLLLEKPSRANAYNDKRKQAYVMLGVTFGIPVNTVRAWERRFRQYFAEKMADPPDKRKPTVDGKPHWLSTVAKRLLASPMHRLSVQSGGGAVSPGRVVATLCAAARARCTLCSTSLYNDVRRALRLGASTINELHAVWVSAQRVSLQQVLVAGRAGDAAHAAPPAAAAEVVDLVLLYTDVDIVTDESLTLYEESAALHTLWQLIQRHRLEDAAPAHSRVRAQRWTRAHRSYLDSGRTVSLVVLQRRWYELKLQARVRLAMHWRRPPAPQIFDDLTPAPDSAPDPATTPQDVHPRPAPLHIAILKRYPHIATGQFKSWQQQVSEGTIVIEPLEEENDVNEQSTDTTDTGNGAAAKQLYPNISKVEQPTVDEPMVEQPPDNDPLTEGPTETDLLEDENCVKKTQSNNNEQSTDTTDTSNDAAVKQLYPNICKVEQPTVDEPILEQPPDNDPLTEEPTDTHLLEEENYVKKTQSNNNEQSTDTTDTGNDAAVKQLYPNIRNVEQPTVDELMVEQPPDDDPLTEGSTDTHLLEEENYVMETQSNNNEQSTDTLDTANDAAVKQLYPNMSKVEQPTVDEPMVEQPPDDDPLTEGSTDTHLLEEENYVKKTQSNNNEQSTDTSDTANDAAVKQLYPNMSKVEQPTVDEPMVEQPPDDDPLTEGSTDTHLFEEENYLKKSQSNNNEQSTDTLDTANDAAVKQLYPNMSKVEQPTVNEPINEQIFYNVPLVELSTADDQFAAVGISSEQTQRAEAMSNEVIPPTRAYSSDTDTDTEDNLVIDECCNKTPCSLKREPVPYTEAHSFDTVSPHAALGNIAPTPTIEVLHMIDPTTVKTEILFESDEDDFQPCNEVDKDESELDAKKDMSFISNRIMFVDEEPGVSCDVKIEDDVTGRMDWEDGQKMDDPVNDTPTIDPKLLMDTQVRIFRIDKTRAWKNNVRKDNSIRVSRIHKRYYTPKPKISNNTKTHTQTTPSEVDLRSSAPLTTTTTAKRQEITVDKFCLDKVANTHSIRQMCNNLKREMLDEQLELLEGKTPNKKAKTESDSEDEKPLLVLREEKPQRETIDKAEDTVAREMVEESSSDDELLNDEMFHAQAVAVRSNRLGGEDRKRRRGAYYAASTIEWSSDFAKVLGRVAKRVSLPDIEQVRRYNSGMQVAQVAPITNTVGACGADAIQAGQPSGGAAADDTPEASAAAPAQHAEPGRLDGAGVSTEVASHTKDLPTFQGNREMQYGLLPSSRAKPLAWHALDLPADDELQAALDDLTTAPAADVGLARSHCCAARRHREVNDTRRRIGLDEIPLHNHPDGVCTCCCAHLSDADARIRLDQQLRALHDDIEQMLRKSGGGKIQSKPAQKHTRSPSPARASTSATTPTAATSTHKQATSTHKPATSTHKQATSAHKQATSAHKQATSAHKQATSAHKQATKDAPSNTATEAKGSKAKPATYANRSKRSRTRGRAPPDPAPAPPAPPVNDYEEWQRQKNMNAKYFHINGNVSSKKDKSTTAQGTAEQSATAQGTAVQSTTAQVPVVESSTAQGTVVQRSTAQATVVQNSTAQATVVQNSTAQATVVQRSTAQATAMQGTGGQSTTAKITAVKTTTAQYTAVQSTTVQGTVLQSTTMRGTALQSTTVHGTALQSTTMQGTALQSTTKQGTTLQSTTVQDTALQSTTAHDRAVQIISVRGTTVQSTTGQSVTKQNTFAQNARPQQNVVLPGLMPYIRQSRLISPLEESPRARPAIPVPPVRGTRTVKIAPKQHNTVVVDEPATTKKGTKNVTIQSFQPHAVGSRRMNLTTEQVSEPTRPVQAMRVTSEPIDKPKEKPVSILEEYSRTLSVEPVNNTPVVNALCLRVPSGSQGPKTTIVMALTLPSDDVIQQTINSLYANDTVDLTKEAETSSSTVIKSGCKHKKNTPFDLVGAVKTLMNPVNKDKNGSRSQLKHATRTRSCSNQLKSIYWKAFDKPPDTTNPPASKASRDKVPPIMSLSNKLHDGDVIEIDDTDSNSSDGNQSSNSNKSSILVNKISNPAVYTAARIDKGSNQAASKTDESSNQAVSNTNDINEAVNKTNESSLLCSTKSQATEDKNKSSSQAADKVTSSQKPNMAKRFAKEKYKNSLAKSNVSEEAVSSHSVARPCSRIPVLTSLTDGSSRCPARFANVAAMTDFMAKLRRAAAQADIEVYCHKWSAVELPVSTLPCGGTLLCVDGSRPPLVLRAREQRVEHTRATPHARAHLVLTDADVPCTLPTYWTLASFGQMSRVMPDDVLLGIDAADADPSSTRACWCEARGEWVTAKENRKICEKNHNFKILTAFCSADGVRQAARAGASLLLLSVLRARVVVLTLQRTEVRGVVRHRASADVEEVLLRELEGLLDEAEIDEELGGRADTADQ